MVLYLKLTVKNHQIQLLFLLKEKSIIEFNKKKFLILQLKFLHNNPKSTVSRSQGFHSSLYLIIFKQNTWPHNFLTFRLLLTFVIADNADIIVIMVYNYILFAGINFQYYTHVFLSIIKIFHKNQKTFSKEFLKKFKI